MNYIEENDLEQNQKEKRPTLLLILCILTFIGSGFSALSQFVSFAMYDTLPAMFNTIADSFDGSLRETYSQMGTTFQQFPQYSYLILALCYVASILGAAFMLNMKRVGFHIYTASQLVVLVLPMIIQRQFGANMYSIFLFLLFVVLYATCYKRMD